MSNPFARHGIDHLSPSSLSLYRNAPSFWCLKYLWLFNDEAGPRAWRGTAVEAGLDKILYEDCGDDAAIETALKSFELNAQGDLSEDVAKQRAAIPDFVRQAGAAFRPLGMPTARQFKIEYWFDGIEIPVIGYIDYLWPEFLKDLKTTFRIPSTPEEDHKVQVSIYSFAAKRPAGLIYVSPKRAAPYDVADTLEPMHTAVKSAHAIRRLLSMSGDRSEIASVFVPDFSSFYWNDKSKSAALELLP